jgi:hypothetical protein
MIHDEKRVDYAEDLCKVEYDNHNLEDKDKNVTILARNTIHMAVYHRMKLPEPPP